MSLINSIIAPEFTLLGAFIVGMFYIYGFFVTRPEPRYKDRKETLIEGLFFTLLFIGAPSVLIYAFSKYTGSLELFNHPLILLSSFLIVSFTAIWLIIKHQKRNKRRLEEELPSEYILFPLTLIGIVAVISSISTGEIPLILASLIIFLFYTLLIANTFGYKKRIINNVTIETEDGSRYHGKLVDEDKYTYSLITVEGRLEINRDKVKTLKYTYGKSSEEADVLQEAVGYRGEFNIITGRTTNKKDITQNIEELKTSMKNWLENEVFDEYRDKDIDVAIVYHYSDPDHAKDLDELLKPIISTLDKKEDEEEPYLVEDDSQIKQILLKSTKTKKGKSGTEPYKDGHGYITISFREHNPKPMKLIKPRVI